jgi:hypothetical protein
MRPRPRQPLLDAYWSFAADRQAAFFRRLHGAPEPWSADPILQDFKFCNVYRAADRVSQYLIRDVIYGNPGFDDEDLLLRIVLFRLFSKIETWQLLEKEHGPLTMHSFDRVSIGRTLEDTRTRGTSIYTNAFILCASDAYGYPRKHDNHLALVETMLFRDRLATKITATRSLQEVFELLIAYPLIGPFMAYQLAIDVNYSPLTNFSENDFTMPGPGALRGIRKCFEDLGGSSPTDIIHWMVDNQESEFERLGLHFEALWSRPLHAIDCQGLFCEVDKYARAAFPDLKSARVRIKTRFRSQGPLPMPYFPPKWGLNAAIERDASIDLAPPQFSFDR